MSCTENESGPFVVFLPAVVGCLTILLARRWANSQVTNTSSTAVSRRRKIIKDPLKRPLPPIACKMVPPGSKKSAGFAKKGSFPVPEDEMNGKRVGRPMRSSSSSVPGAALAEAKLIDGPSAPKHIPFPYIPHDGEILFEVMTFVFTLVATGLQFLNLYRTAWWLQHSHTNQTVNFYLIDLHLVKFIVVIICRRLLLSLSLVLLKAVLAPKIMPQATIAARMFILSIVLGTLAWYAYFMALKHPIIKILPLCYPAVIYFILFGFQVSPFLELGDSTPMHCCSQDPHQIRAEVEVLRQDLNLRLKKILFNSVMGAYYSSFIPLWFAQSYVYYDVYGAAQQVAFVWGGLFARYASQLAGAALCDVPHRAALHLGRWRVDNTCTDIGGEVSAWCGSRLWARGSRAGGAGGGRGRGAVLVADGACVAAEPLDKQHARFYAVFINPSILLCLLLCIQLSLIVLQLCLLFSSAPWHHFVSTVILLVINYYTLFKMLRDYLVAWKVYKAENMIQDKNGAVTVSN